MTDLSACG